MDECTCAQDEPQYALDRFFDEYKPPDTPASKRQEAVWLPGRDRHGRPVACFYADRHYPGTSTAASHPAASVAPNPPRLLQFPLLRPTGCTAVVVVLLTRRRDRHVHVAKVRCVQRRGGAVRDGRGRGAEWTVRARG